MSNLGDKPLYPAAVGALVASFDTGAFVSRRHVVIGRLRQIRDSDQFDSLPDDLQQRVREIVAESERSS
jgi:hypothetical protein